MNTLMKKWRNQPFFTYLFLAIQTIVFILGYLTPMIQAGGVMYGPFVAYMHEYWRFVTPIFLHFGLAHFAINSVILYYMGQQVEAIYGHSRFFCLYILSGIMGNVMSFAFNQVGVQSAGASTSLFGLFGAFLILGLHFKNDYRIQAMVRQFALFVGLNLVFGLFDQSIDIWGHVGGIIGGLLVGNLLALPKNYGKYSIHTRIISGIVLGFLLVIFVIYGLKKYQILV
ncbi:MAG TPA: rhomboid family intramembrane serine protease [Enterococcus sp.]|nr:rhomboid family intramembrane serine protease [Enterococcus sp.]